MPSPHRYRAPAANGEVLASPPFEAAPALVESNRRSLHRSDIAIAGQPLAEFRSEARSSILQLAGSTHDHNPEAPLIVAGHQPELSHPGVWIKHFALHGLARRVGGVPLNLIVDNDTLKSTALRLPVFENGDPESVHFESLLFDTFHGETPYEDRTIRNAELFASTPTRAAPLWHNWGYEPLLASRWPRITAATIGEAFTQARQTAERDWGCANLELPVSRLSRTTAFVRFAQHILADLPRFREVYNAAILDYRRSNHVRSQNHPAPELEEGEAPFWVRHPTDGRRARATATSDPRQLRPRALTLTLFARLGLGDFFIHGIGGGKYDEVTDSILRNYFGIEAPAYQVLSATLHLPLPGFAATHDTVAHAARELRDLNWNPQRHLGPGFAETKNALVANEPPRSDHAARRDWFRALQRVTAELRPMVQRQMAEAERVLARARTEADANDKLFRRDFSWMLYPEATLRPFLQQFLELDAGAVRSGSQPRLRA